MADLHRFVVKDLMVTVVGQASERFATHSDHCTGSCCLNPCSYPSCDNHSCVVTPITGRYGEEVVNPADLAALKEQLQYAIQEVERREDEVRATLVPQSREDIEAAEAQLRAALEDLQALKDER
jgi:hypothetical protein